MSTNNDELLDLQDESLNHDKMLESVISQVTATKSPEPEENIHENSEENQKISNEEGSESEINTNHSTLNTDQEEPFHSVGDATQINGDSEQPLPSEPVKVSSDEASATCDFIFQTYNDFVPPVLAPKLQMDISAVAQILNSNEKVTESKFTEVIALFSESNAYIAEVLKISEEDAQKLRNPLMRVLQKSGLKVDNPYIELLLVATFIGLGKKALINEVQKNQDVRYERMIVDFKRDTSREVSEEFEKPIRQGFNFNPFSWVKSLFKKKKK